MTGARQCYLRAAIAVACVLVVAIAAIVLIEYSGRAFFSGSPASEEDKPTPAAASPTATATGPAQMSLHETPQVVAGFGFEDGSGRALTLADFTGKVVLLNIWATWCIPCRQEMPTLDQLQAELGSWEFQVVALSIDRAGADAVRQFYDEIGIKNLALYIDTSGHAANALGIVGLPATLLIDQQGREIGRLIGPAEWDSPEMVGFLRNHLSERSGAAIPGHWGQAAMHARTGRTPALYLPLATTVPLSATDQETQS